MPKPKTKTPDFFTKTVVRIPRSRQPPTDAYAPLETPPITIPIRHAEAPSPIPIRHIKSRIPVRRVESVDSSIPPVTRTSLLSDPLRLLPFGKDKHDGERVQINWSAFWEQYRGYSNVENSSARRVGDSRIQTQTQTEQDTRIRVFSKQPENMADDKAYEDFLNKANDTGGEVEAKDSKGYKTKSVNAKVPEVLEGVEEYYTSDADEPFEVVSLGFEGSDISAGMWLLPNPHRLCQWFPFMIADEVHTNRGVEKAYWTRRRRRQHRREEIRSAGTVQEGH